ncbi:ferredoxin reductase family protein [Amnibacterium sp. CER49]|uniref:ferredoxin reductase family protein n=1 Tax=Amnibacterium sp. CER49 TaxID=3039161 RepID=UPI0024467FF5|nr:ferredoxin reductase family protein [Amnibacterium sp. CER49]MDH2445173.1 ferredoxin reductase family protein [Amnibacterium sp. CER49]
MTTTPSAPTATAPARTRPPLPPRRLPRRGRPIVADVLAALAGLGLGITLALGISAQSLHSVATLPGLLTAVGRVTGLLASYAMLVTVALSARIGPLERAIGQDRLIRWHRRLGPWGLYLLLAHVVLITVGYAGLEGTGVLHQLWLLVLTYPGMLGAAVATALLFLAGVTSYERARRRFRYETWWTIHLYTYLALLFAFAHQVDDGASFVEHPLATIWWTTIWLALLAAVLWWRFLLPVVRSLRHRIRVADVVRESPDVVSVVLEGRRLDRLPVAGGQFFQWRFLTKGAWWEAHPFSLSHVPHGDRMRITVKDLGDHSRELAGMRAGTPVFIEGPYGRFTADAALNPKVVLIGAGVGVTPLRSILQDLDEHADVAVLLRGRSREDLVLRDEIADEVRRRGGRLWEVLGPRATVRLNATTLRKALPDIHERDVFLCGPEEFTQLVAAECRRAGVPEARIHLESFVL